MTPSGPPSRSPRGRAARAAVALAALGLCAAAVFEHRAWSRQRGRLLDLLAAGGTAGRAPAVARDVERETDPVRAGLRAARGLLADELDLGWQADLAPADLAAARRQGLEKLAHAREIAASALARRPASWQAAQVLGATRYLDALRRRLPMDEERSRAWRRPLLAARDLGPGQAEPLRFLAAATLSEWSRLSPAARDEALGLLSEAFTDAATFDLLADGWLRLAPSRSAAFSVVPPQPQAWRRVGDYYAKRGDWGAFAAAHARSRDALFERLVERLDQAEARLAGGDRRRARWLALEVVATAPPSRRFEHVMARALAILPPGPVGEVRAGRIAAWLDWSRDLCLLGECPFTPELRARMAGLARAGSEAESAVHDEMAGRALAAERRTRGRSTLGREWSPYHLLRARRLADSGDLAAARGALDRVHTDWRRRAAYLEVADRVLPSAAAPSAPPPRLAWPTAAWIDGERPLLELSAAARCAAIELEVAGVPPRGSAIEVYWDGDIAGTYPVTAGRPVRLAVAAAPGPTHRLEIDPFVRPLLRPGSVRLRDCAS